MVSMLDVRRLVEERPGITLRDLACHFRVSENLMAGLVSHLVDRGDLAKVPLLLGLLERLRFGRAACFRLSPAALR